MLWPVGSSHYGKRQMSVSVTTNTAICRFPAEQLTLTGVTARQGFSLSTTKPFRYHGFTAKMDGAGDGAKTPVKKRGTRTGFGWLGEGQCTTTPRRA